MSEPLRTAEERRKWTLYYQRVVGSARSEIRIQGGKHRLDVAAADSTSVEFQQAKDSLPNFHGKELARAAGVMWVFCAINQHFNGDLVLTTRQGARVSFEWTKAWTLIGGCNGRTLLDLGHSPQIGAHVLLEVDHFEVEGRRATGTGVLRDAQEFCYWMRDGHPLLPYSWTPRAA